MIDKNFWYSRLKAENLQKFFLITRTIFSHSRSEQFFLAIGQKHFGKKIPILHATALYFSNLSERQILWAALEFAFLIARNPFFRQSPSLRGANKFSSIAVKQIEKKSQFQKPSLTARCYNNTGCSIIKWSWKNLKKGNQNNINFWLNWLDQLAGNSERARGI